MTTATVNERAIKAREIRRELEKLQDTVYRNLCNYGLVAGRERNKPHEARITELLHDLDKIENWQKYEAASD